MPTRLWANNHWEVADDGMASLGMNFEYFIPRNRLCELRPGREAEGVAMWPLQLADKSWADIESFLEAYQQALERLNPKGLEKIDVALSSEIARDMVLQAQRRKR